MTIRNAPPKGFEREVGPGGLEVRTIGAAAGRLEARASDDEGPVIEGYSSLYDSPATIGGLYYGWDEEVAPGCWDASIAEDDIRSMFNHDENWLLGRNVAGSLDMSSDKVGLHFLVRVNPDDTNAMSVHAKVKRGDVTGASVWFRVVAQEWTYPDASNGLERPKRRITEGRLYENGPVVFPAFELTEVTARSLGLVDQVLRTAGVVEDERRAAMAADFLASPLNLEPQLRELLAQVPDLREAVCSCGTQTSAAPPAEESLRDQRRLLDHHQAFSAGFAACHGLPVPTKES